MGLIKRYGLFGFFRLLRDKILTKVVFNKARIVRRPYYIRGWDAIDFGVGLTTGVNIRIDAFPKESLTDQHVLKIGKDVQINDYVHLAAIESITIGNNVLIASKVFISDHNHGTYSGDNPSSPLETPSSRPLYSAPVVIEDNVWIGENVSVLPGVTIGFGSIIGAMSVVTKDIPANSIAIGSPAKVIKQYNFKEKIWLKV